MITRLLPYDSKLLFVCFSFFQTHVKIKILRNKLKHLFLIYLFHNHIANIMNKRNNGSTNCGQYYSVISTKFLFGCGINTSNQLSWPYGLLLIFSFPVFFLYVCRVEQPNMLVNQTLCRALQHCNKLTRLCLVTHRSQQ